MGRRGGGGCKCRGEGGGGGLRGVGVDERGWGGGKKLTGGSFTLLPYYPTPKGLLTLNFKYFGCRIDG